MQPFFHGATGSRLDNVYAQFSRVVEDTMRDMQEHLEKLRVQISECELIRDFRAVAERVATHRADLRRV